VTSAPTPYQIDWTTDLAIIVGATSVFAIAPLLGGEVIRPTCPCRSSDLNSIDRFSVGRHSDVADRVSNFAEVGLSILPVALDALDVRRSGTPWIGFAEDMVVIAEVVTINGALNSVVKLAVRRPRPNVYDVPGGDPAVTNSGNYLSFYSGHTSSAFSIGMAYATTFALRHPDSLARGATYGVAAMAGSFMGLLRRRRRRGSGQRHRPGHPPPAPAAGRPDGDSRSGRRRVDDHGRALSRSRRLSARRAALLASAGDA
jgi:hypothetical protein